MNYFDLVKKFIADVSRPDQFRHFERTVYWAKELKPDADEALLIAAISHDAERVLAKENRPPKIEEDFSESLKGEIYLKWHQEKGAELVGNFLEENGAPDETIKKVKHLILKHEVGGDNEQNILKDADSLSFFENNVERFLTKISEMGNEKIRQKFDWMFGRITSEKARQIARPWYEVAIEKLEQIN